MARLKLSLLKIVLHRVNIVHAVFQRTYYAVNSNDCSVRAKITPWAATTPKVVRYPE